MAKNTGKRNRRNTRPTVVAPFDRPYRTRPQITAEAQRRAAESVESEKAIQDRMAADLAGAQQIGLSFDQMLAQQAARNLEAAKALQAAAGGLVGSGQITSTVSGAQQRQQFIPRVVAGETSRLQGDIRERGAKELRERGQTYRQSLSDFRRYLEDEEKEKQAARIERESAIRAYDIDRAKLEQDQYEFGVRQANADRAYNLQVAKFNASLDRNVADDADATTSDYIKAVDAMAKAGGTKKGAGGWTGRVTYKDASGEEKTIDIARPVNFDPKGKSLEQRQAFWKNYLKRQGITASGNVNTTGLSRADAKVSARDTADNVISALVERGLSPEDALSVALQSNWGFANAYALRRSYDRNYGAGGSVGPRGQNR